MADKRITPEQCRAARGLVSWSQKHLADQSLVSLMSVRRFEQGEAIRDVLIVSLRQTLEAHGVTFLDQSKMIVGDFHHGVALKIRSE